MSVFMIKKLTKMICGLRYNFLIASEGRNTHLPMKVDFLITTNCSFFSFLLFNWI